jgi:hypothetical protein
MKRILFKTGRLAFTGLLVFTVACSEKNEKNPGADMNGMWYGTWTTSDEMVQGTFVCPVNQSETHIEGNVSIRFDLPSGESYYESVSGKIVDKELRSVIDISGVMVNVTGMVVDDERIDGQFIVSIGMEGNFSGSKIPVERPGVTELYEIANTENYYDKIMYVDDELWIHSLDDGVFRIIDLQGDLIATRSGPEYFTSIAYDGNSFWTQGFIEEIGEPGILRMDHLGEVVQSFNFPGYVYYEISASEQDLFIADIDQRTIYELDGTMQMTDSIFFSSVSLRGFIAYENDFLLLIPLDNYLIRVNRDAQLIAAYSFEQEGDLLSITCNDAGDLWCLTEEFQFRENYYPLKTYRIYKVSMNE